MAHKVDEREMGFRIGATHAAQWFRDIVRDMTASGASNEDISSRLGNLNDVLQDWRQHATLQKDNFPEGNPWDWRQDVLDNYIARQRDDWNCYVLVTFAAVTKQYLDCAGRAALYSQIVRQKPTTKTSKCASLRYDQDRDRSSCSSKV